MRATIKIADFRIVASWFSPRSRVAGSPGGITGHNAHICR